LDSAPAPRRNPRRGLRVTRQSAKGGTAVPLRVSHGYGSFSELVDLARSNIELAVHALGYAEESVKENFKGR
jgi:hypothetical protein